MADVKPWVKYGGPDTSQGTPTQGPWSKYQSGEKAPSGVYVKPAEGLSQQAIAGVYSFLEGASSATRGAAQWLQEKFPGLEEHMPDAFKKSTIEEEV
ncbi:MAG: hypothetical protein KGL35_06165, partial [Bradyrhizobium sp.]|nr:hypothetical protein [Bradyrhizobium sp.]